MSEFQSTPPAQGATDGNIINKTSTDVSIHAPRAGGDAVANIIGINQSGFNPRPPRRGRQGVGCIIELIKFVSIHAPRAGGDCMLITA